MVLFDQRGCGRSLPHAAEPGASLTENNTPNLVADIERLREHLGVDRWLLLGGSWGCTLALTYALAHPERLSAMVLWGVTTGRRREFDWLFRGGLAAFFPAQWQRLVDFLPEAQPDDVPDAYHRLLFDPDADVRRRAAEEWCLWESATASWPPANELAPRFRDPSFALAFARIVTHYVRKNGFVEDAELLDGASRLSDIQGVLINGRYDFQSPLGNAWALHRAWPGSQLAVVDDAGHSGDAAGITGELVRATDAFARP